MKRENIYVGMRVKVKKSSPLTNAVGQYATVIDEPYDGYNGVYVHCLIDGDDDVWTFEDCNLKISDEEPAVGDRIVVVQAEPSLGGKYYENASSGIVSHIDEDGDPKVTFDRGVYDLQVRGGWYIQKSLGQKYAIVRDVEGVK